MVTLVRLCPMAPVAWPACMRLPVLLPVPVVGPATLLTAACSARLVVAVAVASRLPRPFPMVVLAVRGSLSAKTVAQEAVQPVVVVRLACLVATAVTVLVKAMVAAAVLPASRLLLVPAVLVASPVAVVAAAAQA